MTEQVNPASGVAVVFAFRHPGSPGIVDVTLRRLRPGITYRIRSLDDGVLGRASSDELMTRGYTIEESSRSAGQVLVFEPQ